MHIAAFGVRGDEVPYFQAWAARTENQVDLFADYLNVDTCRKAAQAEAITCFQTVPYPAELFAALPVPFLALRNAGFENVDLAAARRHHVRVSYVPAYSPAAIAEFAVMSMLALLRQNGPVQTALHDHDYRLAKTFMGRELGACTVGVIGTGHIGQAVIKILNGFGAKVLISDSHLPKDQTLRYDAVALPQLIATSDIITLHIPGDPSNHHLLDDAAFRQMKAGTLIINTARPNVLDTRALLHHLRSGKLGGVAIDTFEHEADDLLQLAEDHDFNDPMWDELLAMPNVLLSPHIAYYTDVAVRNMVEQALDSLVAFKQGDSVATELT